MSNRELARLNQSVCGLEGMGTLLAQTPGNFAIVVHGPTDCAGLLVQGMDHPGGERIFCTCLSERDLVAGRAGQRLQQCIEAVRAHADAAVVFVLGTCASALVGEDLKGALAHAAGSGQPPIVLAHGGGMLQMSQAKVLDRFYTLMLDAFGADGGSPVSLGVNLVGFDPGPDLCRLLQEHGIAVNAVLGAGVSAAAWSRLGRATWNIHLDRDLFSGFLTETERRFGQRSLQVPPPTGYRGCAGFLGSIAHALLGAKSAISVPPPPALLTEVRSRLTGSRLGYNIGSTKNLDPRTLALEGLADIGAFEELGLDITVLVQGDDRPARLDAVRTTIASFGCGAELAVFADTVQFSDVCSTRGLDLVYASDHLLSRLDACRTAFLPLGSLQPGLSGVEPNLRKILAASHRKAGQPT